RPTDLKRRGLLAGGAAALATAGFARAADAVPAAAPAASAPAAAGLPPYVAWKDPKHLIVHTGSTIETKRSAFGTSVITPADGPRFITGTGGESLPAGLDPKSVIVERSVPLKALDDALLVWEMNGEPLPHAHGGPLRLIVPGYSGVNNIKYIKRLAFTAVETDAAIQKTGYRLSPPRTRGDPAHPPAWEMDVKSWMNVPAPEAGPLTPG